MIARASLALAAAVLSVSCAGRTPLIVLPTGAGTPAADGRRALEEAVAECRTVTTYSAEIGISGKVGRQRLRGRLLAGVAAPDSVYLDAPAPLGASAFIFAAVGNDATLLLPRDKRVIEHGPASDVLEAIAGIALSPQRFLETLTGCAVVGDSAAAEQFGENWRMIPGADRIFLRRERTADRWRVVVVEHREDRGRGWRADYSDVSASLPRRIRLVSLEPDRFDLQLTLSQVEIGVPLEASVFHPDVPRGYAPITLEELKAAGPLAEASSR